MFVITLANPKGGSSKTTTAMILAEQIHHAGARVAILDCDPNRNFVQWKEAREKRAASVPYSIQHLSEAEELADTIDTLEEVADFLIIDLEGTASQLVTLAVGHSDLVIVPFEATPMEARQAARALKLVNSTGRMMKRDITRRLLFTRVNAAFKTTNEKAVHQELEESGALDFTLDTKIVRRSAYTKIFENGHMLSEILEQVKADAEGRTASAQTRMVEPIEKAIENAKAVTQDVLNQLEQEEVAA